MEFKNLFSCCINLHPKSLYLIRRVTGNNLLLLKPLFSVQSSIILSCPFPVKYKQNIEYSRVIPTTMITITVTPLYPPFLITLIISKSVIYTCWLIYTITPFLFTPSPFTVLKLAPIGPSRTILFIFVSCALPFFLLIPTLLIVKPKPYNFTVDRQTLRSIVDPFQQIIR